MSSATVDRLYKLGACAEARAWVYAQPSKDIHDLWKACPHGEWLTWLLGFYGNADEAYEASRIDDRYYLASGSTVVPTLAVHATWPDPPDSVLALFEDIDPETDALYPDVFVVTGVAS